MLDRDVPAGPDAARLVARNDVPEPGCRPAIGVTRPVVFDPIIDVADRLGPRGVGADVVVLDHVARRLDVQRILRLVGYEQAVVVAARDDVAIADIRPADQVGRVLDLQGVAIGSGDLPRRVGADEAAGDLDVARGRDQDPVAVEAEILVQTDLRPGAGW